MFLKQELEQITDGDLLLTFTKEEVADAEHGRIDLKFLKKQIEDTDQNFYVCGPPEMVEDVSGNLKKMGVDPEKIVTEES